MLRTALLAVLLLAAPVSARAQRAHVALDPERPLTYWIGAGSADAGYQEGDRTLAVWALEAWARQLDVPVRMVAGPEEAATIRVHFVSADAGLYGQMRARVVDGRMTADVFVQPDTDVLGEDIAPAARADKLFRDTIVYLTCVHEIGHAFGLPHTKAFADIMYSFQYGGDFVAYFRRFRDQVEERGDIRTASPFSAGDRAAFRALQGGL